MPAETDLLCEYFISSKLNKKKINEPVSATSVLLKLNKNKDSSSLSTSTFSTSSNSFESIEFVRYEKNPMDYLKSKYQLLNSNNSNIKPTINTPTPILTPTPTPTPTNTITLNMHWSKLKKNGIGLYNIGNNCYLNATLQCLAYTTPLSQWLMTRPHSNGCRLKKQKGFCSLCDVERIICDIFSSSNSCAKPNSLCMNIKSK